MPAPSVNEDSKHSKYAIRKSQSVGGFANGIKIKAKETPSLKHRNNIITENEAEASDEEATPVATPLQTPNTARKGSKLGNLFKWFRGESAGPKTGASESSEDLYAKIKKTQVRGLYR